MKQKPRSINGNNDNQVFINERMLLMFIFCNEVSDTQKPKGCCNKKNNVAKHEPKYLIKKGYKTYPLMLPKSNYKVPTINTNYQKNNLSKHVYRISNTMKIGIKTPKSNFLALKQL